MLIGTSCKPAACEARQRRSPAMISKWSWAALHRAHHDRLDHAVLLDRLGKLGEFGIGKGAPWITRVGLEGIRSALFFLRPARGAGRDQRPRRRRRRSDLQDRGPVANDPPSPPLLNFVPRLPLCFRFASFLSYPSPARGGWRALASRVGFTFHRNDPHPDPRFARIDPPPFRGRD